MDINLRHLRARAGLQGAGGRARTSRLDPFHRPAARIILAPANGFSLVEMMVVMAMLSVIVLGLYSVFSTIQRALISNNAQVDVLENGRTTLDLVGREIEGAVAWGRRDTNVFLPHLWTRIDYRNPDNQRPYTQILNDGTVRTNLLQECFFLSRSNNWWMGNGFFVATPTNSTYLGTNEVWQSGVGTLYHFISSSTPPTIRLTSNTFYTLNYAYQQSKTNALQAFPVADGITHFRLRPYDSWGRLMTNNWRTFLSNGVYFTYPNTNIVAQPDLASEGVVTDYRWYFLSNSLPDYLELELGVVKPYILQRMRSIPSPAAQRAYLTNQAGAVSLFHKMIPLRNAQP
jgi:prepilin-type N-terminal cleavage/methylation domain-containing protein